MGQLDNVEILLVEDNKINQMVARELLVAEGASVDIADNGALGVQMVTDYPDKYAIVLMDIQMPVMDGYEATIRLRGMEQGHHLPIIAVTAHALDEDRARCLELGMNDHVSKPLDSDVLIAAIMRVIGSASYADPEIADPSMPQSPVNQSPWDRAGINREQALARLLHKEDLLISILKEYLDEYIDFIPKMEEALGAFDTQLAIQMAHTLKGASGNVGAKDVYERARDLEIALKNGETNLDGHVQAIKDTLNPVLDLARTL